MSPRSSSERVPGRAAGFTLLEILVAISIVAVVLATVYGVFASVSRAKERLERDAEVYQRVRVIYDRLGRELRGVSPVGGPGRAGVFRTERDADGNPSLEMTTSAPARLGVQQTGIALVRYVLAPDREQPTAAGRTLYRSERSVLTDDENPGEGGAMRLATEIDRLEWRFMFQGQWRSELDAAQDGLPQLVEVTLTMIDARGEKLPFRSTFEMPEINWENR